MGVARGELLRAKNFNDHRLTIQTAKPKKKKKGGSSKAAAVPGNAFSASQGEVAPASATTTGTDTQVKTGDVQQRSYAPPKVEELADDE